MAQVRTTSPPRTASSTSCHVNPPVRARTANRLARRSCACNPTTRATASPTVPARTSPSPFACARAAHRSSLFTRPVTHRPRRMSRRRADAGRSMSSVSQHRVQAQGIRALSLPRPRPAHRRAVDEPGLSPSGNAARRGANGHTRPFLRHADSPTYQDGPLEEGAQAPGVEVRLARVTRTHQLLQHVERLGREVPPAGRPRLLGPRTEAARTLVQPHPKLLVEPTSVGVHAQRPQTSARSTTEQ